MEGQYGLVINAPVSSDRTSAASPATRVRSGVAGATFDQALSGAPVTAVECAVCPPVSVVLVIVTAGVLIISTFTPRPISLTLSLQAISTDWRLAHFILVQ